MNTELNVGANVAADTGMTGAGTQRQDSDRRGILEVFNRSGLLLQRLRWAGERVTVGRAYDNDVIVSDPYVCPHHFELRIESGQPRVHDLGSVNGTYLGSSRQRVQSADLDEGQVIQFGHSQMRLLQDGGALAPTWLDSSRHGLLAMLSKSWVLLLAVLSALAVLAVDSLLDNAAPPKVLTLLLDMFYPLLLVLAWSGMWALINRIVAHRSNFHVHLTIALLGVTVEFLTTQAVQLVVFAWDWNAALGWASWVASSAVLFAVLYAHMRYALHGSARRQIWVAAVMSLFLFGVPAAAGFIDRNNFSSLPQLAPLLRPPQYRQVDGQNAAEFFQRAENLKSRLDEAAQEVRGHRED